MSDPLPVLDYAGARHERPVGSRIEKYELPGGGIRLVDPPAGWGGVGGNVALVAGGVVAAGVLLVFIGMDCWTGAYRAMAWKIGWLVFTLALTPLVWLETRRRASWPMVLEAAEGELRLWRPVLFFRFRRWHVEEIGGLKAAVAMPTIGLHGPRLISTVIILGGLGWFGPATQVLVNRDSAEVKWVVRELRKALEMAD